MRPLELRLRHFGPYRGEAVLDFTSLDRLFLVCGPTGAGKTTLFDALTYALYEETPGSRARLADQLVSHHAPEGSVPEVSLRFSLGGDEWRVTRQLRHRVRKQKGEGWKDQDPQVLLEHRVAAGWEALPGKRSEVNQRLVQMLGLSAEEFSKIVVLPQGDFQRFLEASSADRERMLQKLFPVDAYEGLVERLKERARGLDETRRRWEDRWQELTAQTGPEGPDRTDLEQRWAEAQGRALERGADETRATEALAAAQALHADWKLLEQNRRSLETLLASRPHLADERTKLDRARAARPLGPDLDLRQSLTTKGKSLRAEQDDHGRREAEAKTQVEAFEAQASDREAREAALAETGRLRGRLEQDLVRYTEARKLAGEEDRARAEEAQKARELQTAQDRRIAAEADRSPEPAGGPLEDRLAARDAAQTAYRAARDRADRALRRTLAEAALSAARAVHEQAQTELRLWDEVVASVQAAALAVHLGPDEACPVCGSTTHPRPATYPEASKEAPRRLDEARRAAEAATRTLAEAQAAFDALSPVAGDEGPRVEVAEAALAAAQAAVDAWTAWNRRQTEAEARLTQARAAEAQAQAAHEAARRSLEALQAQRSALAEGVAEDPGPRLAALRPQEQAARTALESERRAQTQAQATLAAAQARVVALEDQLKVLRDEVAGVNTRLEEGLKALGWTRDELEAARLPEAALADLESSLVRFDQERHRLEGQIAALADRFQAGAPSPWEPLQELVTSARTARVAEETAAKELEFQLRTLDQREEELREVRRQRDAAAAEAQKVVPLAQALDGRNPKNLRLTTWVLVQALEQIAGSATHRLAQMSGGRYALKVQAEGLDGRRTWGLDLAVIDSFTGQERAVGTLSGGEKFMTSISLALGLADVIQERSGGVKLEAIFIDEGFGTLDDQSLDRAMAILSDLGQHRSVGLISHVAELRQRIPSQVEVVKTKTGSTLRVGQPSSER